MRRLEIGIFIALIALLAGCGIDPATLVEEKMSQAEITSPDKAGQNTTEEPGSDDTAEKETAGQETDAESTEDIAKEDSRKDNLGKNNSGKDDSGKDDSNEEDTVYLKPCVTYQDILDNAYEVIVADRGADIVEADKLFSTAGIREAGIGRDTDEALAHIGYTFYDVDGNGIEELIIADMLDGDGGPWDNRILLMYTLHEEKPVLLIDGWARNRYYLLNDNTIFNEGSGGAAYTVFAIYRMAEDGIRLEVMDYYYSGYYGDSEWGWFHNTTGEMTEDEGEIIEFEDEKTFVDKMDAYLAQVKELELTFFETMN